MDGIHGRLAGALRLATLVMLGTAGAALAAAALLPPVLQMDEEDARTNLMNSIGWGSVPLHLGAEAFKLATPPQKVELVRGTIAWARGFVATPAFAQAYAAVRKEREPEAPQAKGSVDDELKAQRAERQRNLADMKASLKQMPPAMQKDMAAMVKETEKQFAQMDSDPEMVAMQRQGLEMQRKSEHDNHAARLAEWQQEWPADGRVLVARRLREFLTTCKDVDFNAALAPRDQYGKRSFVNAAYEAKPADWKVCYRAGKAPVEAARAAANAWLAELPKA